MKITPKIIRKAAKPDRRVQEKLQEIDTLLERRSKDLSDLYRYVENLANEARTKEEGVKYRQWTY